MSPFLQNRNVPLIQPPKGGSIGADGDEPGGIAESGSAGGSAQQASASSGREPADACELSAGQAVVEALSRGRRCGPEASRRGASLQPRLSGEVLAAGARSGAGEVRRAGGRTFRADTGGRALGYRRWAAGECRDAAAVDAGSGVVESGAEAAEAPAAPGAQGAFWGTRANGWQLSRLAGGAWPRRL